MLSLRQQIAEISPDLVIGWDEENQPLLALNGSLKDYIDIKDIPFRLIKDIISFDEGIIAELSRWVEKVQIRLNIFKMLVDFLFDIRKRDGGFEIIEDEVLLKMDDKALYDYVMDFKNEYFKKYQISKVLYDGKINVIKDYN